MAVKPELLDPSYGEKSRIRIADQDEAAGILTENVRDFLKLAKRQRERATEIYFFIWKEDLFL